MPLQCRPPEQLVGLSPREDDSEGRSIHRAGVAREHKYRISASAGLNLAASGLTMAGVNYFRTGPYASLLADLWPGAA
jgi:hypothetical protein